MNKITVFALPLKVMTSCVSKRSNQAAVNVSRPAEPKTELQICVNKVSKAILSREQKISSIARKWTYGGGAKYGSGGIGRASIEADIWADAEMSKLAGWKYRQLERCNSMAARTTSSPRNIPPPLSMRLENLKMYQTLRKRKQASPWKLIPVVCKMVELKCVMIGRAYIKLEI